MASDEPSGEIDFATEPHLNAKNVPALDRHPGMPRYAGATVIGVVAGFLILNSLQVGVNWATGDSNFADWNTLRWGDHWVWRGMASTVATVAAGFLAGMVARNRGVRVAISCTVPTVCYWALMAWIGWTGQIPVSGVESYLPLGYRIVATILAFVSLPLAAAAGVEGAGYGRANSEHFDARRATLLGVRWYHFLWLPFLVHIMIAIATFGTVYGFQWFLVVLRNGFSLLVIIPTAFYIAMLLTLQLLGTGAFRTYEALAGFTDDANTSVCRRVIKYGFGYTALTALAQAGVTLVHYGLATGVRKLLG